MSRLGPNQTPVRQFVARFQLHDFVDFTAKGKPFLLGDSHTSMYSYIHTCRSHTRSIRFEVARVQIGEQINK